MPLILGGFEITLPDTHEYLAIAGGLLDGHGFETETLRTPVYPSFLALVSLLPGNTVDPATILQHLLGIAMAPAVFLVADRYLGRAAAVFSGVLMALTPTMTLVEHHLVPDFLFGVLVLASVVVVCELATRPQISTRLLIAAGLLFGVAALTKPSGQALILVVPVVLAYATRSVRSTLRSSAIALAAMLAVIGPWVAYNAIEYGHATVSSQAGTTLWLRAFDQDKYPVPTDSADARFAEAVYRESVDGLTPAQRAMTTGSYFEVFNALLARGDSIYDANATMGAIAKRAILDHPWSYFTGTLRNIGEYAGLNNDYWAAESAYLADTHDLDFDRPRYLTTRVAWAVAELLAKIGWSLSLALLAVPLLVLTGERRRRIAALALISTWLAIAVSGSLTNFVEARFAAQIAPIQWMLEGAAAALVLSAVATICGRPTGRFASTGPTPGTGGHSHVVVDSIRPKKGR